MEKGGRLPEMAHQQGVEEEMRACNRAQAILAISEYVEDHQLPFDPMVIVQRGEHATNDMARTYQTDTRPGEIRDTALRAWMMPVPGREESPATLFRAYWQTNRPDIEAAITAGQSARIELIKKILAIGN